MIFPISNDTISLCFLAVVCIAIFAFVILSFMPMQYPPNDGGDDE
jgi:hypothetical protein